MRFLPLVLFFILLIQSAVLKTETKISVVEPTEITQLNYIFPGDAVLNKLNFIGKDQPLKNLINCLSSYFYSLFDYAHSHSTNQVFSHISISLELHSTLPPPFLHS